MKKIAIFAASAIFCGAIVTSAFAGTLSISKPTDSASPTIAQPTQGGRTPGSAAHQPSSQQSPVVINDSKNISDGAAKGQASE